MSSRWSANLSIPSDFYRRKNEAERRKATQQMVETRKAEWREKGLLNDVPHQRDVDVNEEIWRGRRWWEDKPWVRRTVNVLIALTVVKIGMVMANMENPFQLAFWIPVLMFLCQLRLHIGRFGA